MPDEEDLTWEEEGASWDSTLGASGRRLVSKKPTMIARNVAVWSDADD